MLDAGCRCLLRVGTAPEPAKGVSPQARQIEMPLVEGGDERREAGCGRRELGVGNAVRV